MVPYNQHLFHVLSFPVCAIASICSNDLHKSFAIAYFLIIITLVISLSDPMYIYIFVGVRFWSYRLSLWEMIICAVCRKKMSVAIFVYLFLCLAKQFLQVICKFSDVNYLSLYSASCLVCNDFLEHLQWPHEKSRSP